MAKGQAFGVEHGRKVNTIRKKDRRKKPSNRKGRLGNRTKFVRQIIREICGFAPYEKRIIELLKTGQARDRKRAYRFAKVRLGTHKRATAKRHELEEMIRIENLKLMEEREKRDAEKREQEAKEKRGQEQQ